MTIEQSHFALFGLAPRFEIDSAALDLAYRQVQGQVHPDRFVSSDAAAQRVALQWATRANEAYQVLRDPVRRARYLCELRGIDLAVESNTAMSVGFLTEQMEWREALDEARDAKNLGALDSLVRDLSGHRAAALARIKSLFETSADDVTLRSAVRELMFLDRFAEDIRETADTLDS
jgi:molecular chaperone HscB